MWINSAGALYFGDCAQGDRAATGAEVTAWQAARAAAVPQQVTAAQIVRALDKMGLLVAVQNAATQAGGVTLALWQHAPFFHRADPLVAQIATAIGKTAADVDALFVLAATF